MAPIDLILDPNDDGFVSLAVPDLYPAWTFSRPAAHGRCQSCHGSAWWTSGCGWWASRATPEHADPAGSWWWTLAADSLSTHTITCIAIRRIRQIKAETPAIARTDETSPHCQLPDR
jgi:hypothetical protein